MGDRADRSVRSTTPRGARSAGFGGNGSPGGGGDGDIFWKIWLENQDYLRSYGYRLLGGNSQEVDDILGSLMLKAYEKYQQIGVEVRNPRAWLTRILFNLCMDWYRRTAPVTVEEPSAPGMEPVGGNLDPEAALLNGERIRLVAREISRLPKPLKRVFVLRVLHGRQYAEIALRLNLTSCNARKRVQLARDRLRKVLRR